MPKMKTHKGLDKRIKKTGSGKLKKKHAFSRHLKEKKTSRRKRAWKRDENLAPGDKKRVRRLIS